MAEHSVSVGPHPVRDDGVTVACDYCGTAFAASGRRRYCSNACRQRSFRARNGTAPAPLRLKRAPMAATVYQCPECDERYLGHQRCEPCGVFCRRVGTGGPVAVIDLLGDGAATIFIG